MKKAFTLTEMLIVLSLIVVLAIIGIAALRSQIFKGKDARRKGDLKHIQIAVEEYEKDHDCYPLPQLVLCAPGTGLKPYISKIPCDPSNGSSYYYEHEDTACPSWYRLYAVLENKKDVDACTNGCGPGLAFNYYASSPNAPLPQAGTPAPVTPAGSTPPPGSSSPPSYPTGFYGCRGGICVPIVWNPARPGPECDPSYQNSTCYDQCMKPETECVEWQ